MGGTFLFYVTILVWCKYCDSGYKKFLIQHVTSHDHVFRGLCDLNRLKFLLASHIFTMLSGHRPCGISDTAAKIIYVTLQDHVIKGSGDFMEGNSFLYIPTQSKLMAIDIVLTDI